MLAPAAPSRPDAPCLPCIDPRKDILVVQVARGCILGRAEADLSRLGADTFHHPDQAFSDPRQVVAASQDIWAGCSVSAGAPLRFAPCPSLSGGQPEPRGGASETPAECYSAEARGSWRTAREETAPHFQHENRRRAGVLADVLVSGVFERAETRRTQTAFAVKHVWTARSQGRIQKALPSVWDSVAEDQESGARLSKPGAGRRAWMISTWSFHSPYELSSPAPEAPYRSETLSADHDSPSAVAAVVAPRRSLQACYVRAPDDGAGVTADAEGGAARRAGEARRAAAWCD